MFRSIQPCQSLRFPILPAQCCRKTGQACPRIEGSALFKSSNSNGSERSRLPVTAKIAFETAGAMGGTPGSPRRLVRFSDMKVHGWHIRQAQWLISIEIGLIDYTIGQCEGAGIDLRLCLFAASPTERGGPSPKFQHTSGADVSPVLSSARACRADSDPVRTHDGANSRRIQSIGDRTHEAARVLRRRAIAPGRPRTIMIRPVVP